MAYSIPQPPGGGGKNKTLTWVLLGVGGICLVFCGLGAVGTINGIKSLGPAVGNMLGCTLDAEMLQKALKEYETKNGKYPNADTWKADVKPFFAALRKKGNADQAANNPVMKITLSDLEGEWGCTSIDPKTKVSKVHAFAYNTEVAGKKISDIKNPDVTILLFETPNPKNSAAPYAKPTEKTGDALGNEMREWLKIPVEGEIKDSYNPGAGSPASR